MRSPKPASRARRPRSGEGRRGSTLLTRKIREVAKALEAKRRAGPPGRVTRSSPALVDELATSLEELHVTAEELEHQNEELLAARQALETARQRYLELFDLAPDAYLVTDAAGVVQEANHAASLLLGVAGASLVGKPVAPFVAGSDRTAFYAKLRQLGEPGAETLHDWELGIRPRGGGEVPVSVAVGIARNHEGRPAGLRFLLRDITERKGAEQGLREAQRTLEARVSDRTAQLQQANADLAAKNAELERFSYSVSHDLKTPLVTIRGFLDMLEESVLEGNMERFRADVARIAQAADRMDGLLKDILELSRIGRVVSPPREIQLRELAAEARDLTQGRRAGREIQVVIAEELPVVRGDRQRLLQVLENLMDNAAKFMGDQPRPRIEVGVRTAGAQPVVFVNDNGIGIAPHQREKVFALFEKLDPRSEGTGIGLAIVRRIVDAHGGRVWVEPGASGAGSTFCFTLGAQDGGREAAS